MRNVIFWRSFLLFPAIVFSINVHAADPEPAAPRDAVVYEIPFFFGVGDY